MKKPISEIVNKIGSEWRLPPFQRDFVWNNKKKILDFVDSIYQKWPIGSIILWVPREGEIPEEEREFEVKPRKNVPKYYIPKYVLDGQQRLTTIKKIVDGESFIFRKYLYVLHYDFENNKFRFIRGNDSRKNCISLSEIFKEDIEEIKDSLNLDSMKKDVGMVVSDLRNNIYDRDISYIHETEKLEREKALELFIRVNTGGKQLKSVDLALGYLSLIWPESRKKLESFKKEIRDDTSFDFDLHFFVRCLSAVSLQKSITKERVEDFEGGEVKEDWEKTEEGIRRLIDFLKSELRLESNNFIKAENTLIPIALILSEKHEKIQGKQNLLAYWFCINYMNQRLSGQSTRVLDHDIGVVLNNEDPISELLRNRNLEIKRGVVTENNLNGEFLEGKNRHLRLLLLILARYNKTRDPLSGHRISSIAMSSENKPNFDHIFPKSELKESEFRGKQEEIANKTLLASLPNKKKSGKKPSEFLPEIDRSKRKAHFIPTKDENLYEIENYPEFLKHRRKLLSEGIRNLLKSFKEG